MQVGVIVGLFGFHCSNSLRVNSMLIMLKLQWTLRFVHYAMLSVGPGSLCIFCMQKKMSNTMTLRKEFRRGREHVRD